LASVAPNDPGVLSTSGFDALLGPGHMGELMTANHDDRAGPKACAQKVLGNLEIGADADLDSVAFRALADVQHPDPPPLQLVVIFEDALVQFLERDQRPIHGAELERKLAASDRAYLRR
jgi:hypothetical protein